MDESLEGLQVYSVYPHLEACSWVAETGTGDGNLVSLLVLDLN